MARWASTPVPTLLLEQFAQEVRAAGARPIFVTGPASHQYGSRTAEAPFQEVCAKGEIECIDLMPAFADAYDAGKPVAWTPSRLNGPGPLEHARQWHRRRSPGRVLEGAPGSALIGANFTQRSYAEGVVRHSPGLPRSFSGYPGVDRRSNFNPERVASGTSIPRVPLVVHRNPFGVEQESVSLPRVAAKRRGNPGADRRSNFNPERVASGTSIPRAPLAVHRNPFGVEEESVSLPRVAAKRRGNPGLCGATPSA